MKALILAGGKGTRLRPLTYTSAKQLIPIANKPTIQYGIEAIIEAGITDIGIIVGDTKKDIMTALGDGSQFGAHFTYIEQDHPRGLAHAVMISEDFMDGDSFLMYLGDNVVQDGVKNFVDDFQKQNQTHSCHAMVLLNPVSNPSQYGVVVLEDGQIVRLIEKPKVPPSNLALVGVYLFDKNIFTAVKNIKPSWRNEYEITDAIQWLVDQKLNVSPHIIHNWWKDTGKPEDMLEANRILLEKIRGNIKGDICEKSHISRSVQIGEGSMIENSTIRGPAIIGKNVHIKNAYIGPFTSIGDETQIINAEVENSIIMEHSKIEDINTRLDSCLLGRGVQVCSQVRRPKSIALVLGDNSTVDLSV